MAAVGAASQSTSETVDERRLERAAPGGTTVDLDEWEAIVARCDKVFGRLLNRTAGEVAAARVEACAVFDALECVTGTYVSQADQLARELRRRYGEVLGPKAAAAVTPAALVPDDATTDGGASEAGEGEPAEEHGDVPQHYLYAGRPDDKCQPQFAQSVVSAPCTLDSTECCTMMNPLHHDEPVAACCSTLTAWRVGGSCRCRGGERREDDM